MILLAGSLDIDASPSSSRPGPGAAQPGVDSVWYMLPALRRIVGPQLHGIPGKRPQRQTDEAVALCQLRQLRGSRHPGQPREGHRACTAARKIPDRASTHRTAARSGDRHESVSGS